MRRITLAICCTLSLFVCQNSFGQESPGNTKTIRLPKLATTNVSTDVSVPDGGAMIIGGGVFRPDHLGRMIRQSKLNAHTLLKTPDANLRDRVCKQQIWKDGMYFNILHDKKAYDITVRGEKIVFELTKTFTNPTFHELADSRPDLAKKLSAMASQNGEIEIQVRVPIKKEFANLNELKWNAPELFVVYHEYLMEK